MRFWLRRQSRNSEQMRVTSSSRRCSGHLSMKLRPMSLVCLMNLPLGFSSMYLRNTSILSGVRFLKFWCPRRYSTSVMLSRMRRPISELYSLNFINYFNSLLYDYALRQPENAIKSAGVLRQRVPVAPRLAQMFLQRLQVEVLLHDLLDVVEVRLDDLQDILVIDVDILPVLRVAVQQLDVGQVDGQLLPAALKDVGHFLVPGLAVARVPHFRLHTLVVDGDGRALLPHRTLHCLHQLPAAHVSHQQPHKRQLQGLHHAPALHVLDRKGLERKQQLESAEVVDALQCSAVVVERLALSSPPALLRSVLLLLHTLVDALRDCPELLCLQEGGGADEVAVEEHAEVVDGLLEVAVGELGDAGQRARRLSSVRVVLPQRVTELLGSRGGAADLGADAQVLDLGRSE